VLVGAPEQYLPTCVLFTSGRKEQGHPEGIPEEQLFPENPVHHVHDV
jgi:hypothetical protein